MAPSYGIGSRYGDDAQLETFKMTNIVPQRSTLNQVTWKGLEHLISKEMAEAYDGLWVLVGPILPNESELTWYNNKAAMPTAFYCILTDVDEDEMAHVIALILTQEDTGTRKLGEFMTTVDNVEKATGLDFFADLPDAEEVALESTVGDAGEWFGEETLIIP